MLSTGCKHDSGNFFSQVFHSTKEIHMSKSLIIALAFVSFVLSGCGAPVRVGGYGSASFSSSPVVVRPVSPYRGVVYHDKEPAAPTTDKAPCPGAKPVYTNFDGLGRPIHTRWRC